MDFLTDWLTDWLKELLIGGIMGNLEGLFYPSRRDRGTGGDYPGGVERRGIFPHPPAFRNGDLADCRAGADLCCHL